MNLGLFYGLQYDVLLTFLILYLALVRHFLYLLHSVQDFPFIFVVEFTNPRFSV
jgi:hypothetical protein